MDDVFNENCPGVAEGLFEFHRQNLDPIPVVQGFGQTVLERKADAAVYRQWFRAREWEQFFSVAPLPSSNQDIPGATCPAVPPKSPSNGRIPCIWWMALLSTSVIANSWKLN